MLTIFTLRLLPAFMYEPSERHLTGRTRPHRAGRYLAILLGLLVTVTLPVPGQHHNKHDARALAQDPRLSPEQIAPILAGLGSHHHPVTSASERAQIFFDQGLKLTYGFNHQEALRAFKEAARLDPECAMAYWGWALVLGPNLNLPMRSEVVSQAYSAVQEALAHVDRVSEKEADYIRALARRYAAEPSEDRSHLDLAYAQAMRSVHRKYPEDQDAATLFAASLMNLSPWNYWTPDGRPNEHTPEILETLEAVIEKHPEHEGALHYYIHAVEAAHPRKGESAADRLRGLAPGAGHLTHMPSHIYMQTGRYSEAFEQNVLASLADEAYITQCRAQGIYPLNYYPHNVHFLAWAGMMLGRSRETLAASRKIADHVPPNLRGNDWALYQTFLSMPLYSMVRFGMWDQILSEPLPGKGVRFWRGISHYARGLAHVHKNNLTEAERELVLLRQILQDPSTEEVLIGFSNAQSLLKIATSILVGELAAQNGRFNEAIGLLERAVRLQDGVPYTEPPDWYYPVRHTLGAVLLEADRAAEAETVYWTDLRRYPENPYSLLGLAKSLRAQGKDAEAVKIEERFERSWAQADYKLTSSRF